MPGSGKPLLSEEKAREFLESGEHKNDANDFTGFVGFLGRDPAPAPTAELEALTERVESLEALIKYIFDGHVLINGRFVKITV